MKRGALIVGGALVLVAAFGVARWRRQREAAAPPAREQPASPTKDRDAKKDGRDLPPPKQAPGVLAAEKRARLEKIRRDYEDLALKLGEEFKAAGASFPGGLNAYFRQLVLLEREKRTDYAAFLTPLELENHLMSETSAGKAVQQWLGASTASEDQRREVFRLQLEFDDKFSLIFDLTPGALYARENERQALQDRILNVLGPDAFGAWLGVEDFDYPKTKAFLAQQGLRPGIALELWRIKGDLTLRNLEIAANAARSASEKAAMRNNLINQTRTRVGALVGPGGLSAGGSEIFDWLLRLK